MEGTTLGALLRSVRDGANASQVSAATAAGLSRETIRRWECDLVAPSLSDLHAYLDLFGVPAEVHTAAEETWLARHRGHRTAPSVDRSAAENDVRRVRDEDVSDDDGLPVRRVDVDEDEEPVRRVAGVR